MKIGRIAGLIVGILAAIGQMTCEPTRAAELPSKADVETALDAAYEKHRSLEEGKNADYIPALAQVDPGISGSPW
jgi:glutaminase